MRVVSLLFYMLALDAVILAVVAYIWDVSQGFEPRLLAEHLIELGASLEAWQAGIQRHISADLWDQVLVPALTSQTIMLGAALAVIFAVAGYAAQPRRQ